MPEAGDTMADGTDCKRRHCTPPVSFADAKRQRRARRERQLIDQAEDQRQLKTQTAAVRGGGGGGGREVQFASQRVRRRYTLAVAVAGSVLDNAQSAELRTLLTSQVARAAATHCADEVVVFDDGPAAEQSAEGLSQQQREKGEQEEEAASVSDSCRMMATILQYLECPQYLRKRLFPRHDHLRHVGLASPLECPHHLRRDQQCRYREGVVLPADVPTGGCRVDVGLTQPVLVDRQLQPGVRVTVRLKKRDKPAADTTAAAANGGGGGGGGVLRGRIVSPREPCRRLGVYWGYTVRVAASLSRVFTETRHAAGYDLLVGTSHRGLPLPAVRLAPFRHALVVFGGVDGLEAAIDHDRRLHVQSPQQLFDVYVNACVDQGTRTIRTEEALPIVLTALKPLLVQAAAAAPPAAAAADGSEQQQLAEDNTGSTLQEQSDK